MRTVALSLLAVSFSLGTLNPDGISGVNQTFSAASAGHLRLGVSLGTFIANDESDLGGSALTRNNRIYDIDSYLALNSQAALSLGLGSFSEIAVAMPLYYERLEGDDRNSTGTLNVEEQLQGDLQWRIKAELPIREQKTFHLALLLGGSVPTAADGGTLPRKLELYTNDRNDFNGISTPFGTGRPGFQAALGMTFDFAAVEKSNPELRWHLNAGARKPSLVADPPFDDILLFGTAVEWGVNPYLLLVAEAYHESRFGSIGSADWLDTEPTTLTLGGAARFPGGFNIHAGTVVGLGGRKHVPVAYGASPASGDAFSMTTAPLITLFARVEWSGFVASQDKDRDGIPNKEDKCPFKAEDLDGFEDQDGCPDLDDDKDGIPDTEDKCRLEAEDMDGYQDTDGCPDPDNDRDGVPDEKDKCPMDAQGPGGKDGCPNLDADNDGVPNDADKCPNEAEDKDGFEDEDGCPDLDNDKDGIPDAQDKCPNLPETVNKFEDEDGCPDKVEVKTKEVIKTMILKGVNFQTGSAELTAESFATLDGVAADLLKNPSTKFEVAGHTDSRGSAVKNQSLSQARAQTVANYFIHKGVDPGRLRVMGYGPAKPIASNNSAEGRALNRRVELNPID
jgi:outer membrane protein OmpA-like peptidoglycan-associated protein